MWDFEKRIRRLEAQLPKPLVILCRTTGGTVREITADEFISNNADFVKVVRGSSLRDLDKVLDSFGGVI